MYTHHFKLSREEYRNDYLKSDHWKEKREIMLRRYKVCEKCRKVPPTDIHHCDYRNLYNVNRRNLAALCRPCHERIEHAKRIGLLPNPHTRQQAFYINDRRIAFFKKAKLQLCEKDFSMISVLSSIQQKLIAGILKIPKPKNWNALETMKVSKKKHDKVMKIISEPPIVSDNIYYKMPAGTKVRVDRIHY